MPVTEAQARAQGLGLNLSVAQEVEDPQQPAGVVIAQDPPPGATLHPGETIRATVNRGAPAFPVVSVLGYTLDENILNGLRSYGWGGCGARSRRAASWPRTRLPARGWGWGRPSP
ncbi:MAG: hypothetical protein C4314_05770 [Thermoflexus sp.]